MQMDRYKGEGRQEGWVGTLGRGVWQKEKKKGVEKNVGSFHPIHKITKWDFLDGALVGVGSLRPYFDQLSKLVT